MKFFPAMLFVSLVFGISGVAISQTPAVNAGNMKPEGAGCFSSVTFNCANSLTAEQKKTCVVDGKCDPTPWKQNEVRWVCDRSKELRNYANATITELILVPQGSVGNLAGPVADIYCGTNYSCFCDYATLADYNAWVLDNNVRPACNPSNIVSGNLNGSGVLFNSQPLATEACTGSGSETPPTGGGSGTCP